MPKRYNGKFSKKEKLDAPSMERTVRWAPLAGVLVGIALATAGLVSLFIVMRTVGLENEGSCVSGGPYQIAPGHECQDGVFALAFGGAIGIFVGFLIFAWSSNRYGGPLVVTSASGIGWSALFGGLASGFLSVASELPVSSDVGSEFKTVGIVFLVMAALGLAVVFGPVPYSLRSGRLDYPKPTLLAWLAWFGTVAVAFVLGILALELTLRIFY